jgi:cell division protein FtsX
MIHFLSMSEIMRMLIPAFLVVGIAVGILGSLFSLRKYLKV